MTQWPTGSAGWFPHGQHCYPAVTAFYGHQQHQQQQQQQWLNLPFKLVPQYQQSPWNPFVIPWPFAMTQRPTGNTGWSCHGQHCYPAETAFHGHQQQQQQQPGFNNCQPTGFVRPHAFSGGDARPPPATGPTRPEVIAQAPTEVAADPHLHYVRKLPWPYKPAVYRTRECLTLYLRTNVLVNNGSRTLTGIEIEALSLGLTYVPPAGYGPGRRSRMLEADSKRWTLSINRSIHFARLRDTEQREKGRAIAPRPSGILESSGRLGKEANDWDPLALSHNEWTQQPFYKEFNDKFAKNTLTGVTPEDEPDRKMSPLHESIRLLGKDKSIHILVADKGGTTVILDSCDYDREANRKLGDSKTYTELSKDEYTEGLRETSLTVKDIAARLLREGSISKNEHNTFLAKLETPLAGSYIYFLPKIHKAFNEESNTFPGRPIVATFTCVVHTLDKFITQVTQPLLAIIPGALRDTTDFLNKLPKGPLPAGARIITADVDSLYPSIPWREGIEAATAFYADNINLLRKHHRENGLLPPPSIGTFHDAITTVITRSFITFKGRRFFRQASGTSMGSCISVYLANAFMYWLTKHAIPHGIDLHASDRPLWLLFFERFIDDLILIISAAATAEQIAAFFAGISTETITYTTTEPHTCAPFLDIQLSICQETLELVQEPYSKPTSRPTFLHASSNHPTHSIDSMPYAQFVRLKRNSSTDAIFRKHARRLEAALALRGYAKKKIKKAFRKAAKQSRQALLTRKADRPDTIGPPLRRTAADEFTNSFKYVAKYDNETDWKSNKRLIVDTHAKALDFYGRKAQQSNTDENQRRDALTAVRVLSERNSTLVFSTHNSANDSLTRNYKRPGNTTDKRPRRPTQK